LFSANVRSNVFDASSSSSSSSLSSLPVTSSILVPQKYQLSRRRATDDDFPLTVRSHHRSRYVDRVSTISSVRSTTDDAPSLTALSFANTPTAADASFPATVTRVSPSALKAGPESALPCKRRHSRLRPLSPSSSRPRDNRADYWRAANEYYSP
jgi:hypothetical protein